MFDVDLKFNKVQQLSDIFKNEEIKDHGIYHMQRNIEESSKENIMALASHDINNMFESFSKGSITYASYIEKDNVKILTLTIRLVSNSILKYVVSSNTLLDNRLRLNFSVNGRVIEYDDANAYLNTSLNVKRETDLTHNDKTREVLNMIEVAIND